MRLIRIVSPLIGNRPPWLCRAWVGCELIAYPPDGQPGYSVCQKLALKALELQHPDAALAYYKEGYPFVGGGFRFCEDRVVLLEPA